MAKLSRIQLWNIADAQAGQFGLDPALVVSVIMAESAGDPSAARFEPKFRWAVPFKNHSNKVSRATEANMQMTSWGLMQVMGSNLRAMGYAVPFLCEIVGDADLQVYYGSRFLGGLLKRYGSVEDAVSAYNQGSPRKSRFSGAYRNQAYVSKIMGTYAAMQVEVGSNGIT